MRRVSIDYLKPGDVLAHPVKSPNGSILLTKGIKINHETIKKLSKLGVFVVYVEDDSLPNMSISQMVLESTRKESIEAIKEVMLKNTITKEVTKNSRESINLNRLTYVVNNLVDDLLTNINVLSSFAEVRLLDNYTYNHSLDVCIYSLILGHKLKYTRTQLLELGLGAILHDVGKSKIPIKVINKPGILTPEEYQIVKEHPVLGYEIIRNNKKIPLLSAHIAFQHHERYNGSGYPRKLKGDEIHPYAYIVGLVDMFDALTAEKEYRPKFSLKEAVEIIEASKDVLFPKNYVEKFLECIALYPNGHKVKLSSGDIGVVIGQGISPLKPIIKIIENHTNIHDYIDLGEGYDITIEEIINE